MTSNQRKRILRLQAESFRTHGITHEQFLGITPAELTALNADALREFDYDRQLEDRRVARLIAAIYNASPNKKRGKIFSETDFLPQSKAKAQSGNSADNLLAKAKWIHNSILASTGKTKK